MARDKNVVISTRISAAELDDIYAAAQAEGMTLSAYMRNCALRAALLARPGARVIKSADGSEIVFWTNRPDLVSVS